MGQIKRKVTAPDVLDAGEEVIEHALVLAERWGVDFSRVLDAVVVFEREDLDLPEQLLIAAIEANVNLDRAMLGGQDYTGIHFPAGNISGAILSGSVFDNADLSNVTAVGIDAHGSSFRGANLNGAVLRNADLNGSDFTGATFEGADLTGANTSGSESDPQEVVTESVAPRRKRKK